MDRKIIDFIARKPPSVVITLQVMHTGFLGTSRPFTTHQWLACPNYHRGGEDIATGGKL